MPQTVLGTSVFAVITAIILGLYCSPKKLSLFSSPMRDYSSSFLSQSRLLLQAWGEAIDHRGERPNSPFLTELPATARSSPKEPGSESGRRKMQASGLLQPMQSGHLAHPAFSSEEVCPI